MDQNLRTRQIAEAAYFKAQRRGFNGERELDDWLEAEREIATVPPPGAAPNDPSMPQEPDSVDASADIPQPDQRSGAPVPAPLGKENSIRVDEAIESAEQLKASTGK